MTAPDPREAVVAEALCRDDRTWAHHERTDDFPCSDCKGKAVVALAALDATAAEQDTTDPADALSQRVTALLDECRCTLQYPGFDRAPFTNDASCPAHATDYTGLKRRLRALLATRQEGASK